MTKGKITSADLYKLQKEIEELKQQLGIQ